MHSNVSSHWEVDDIDDLELDFVDMLQVIEWYLFSSTMQLSILLEEVGQHFLIFLHLYRVSFKVGLAFTTIRLVFFLLNDFSFEVNFLFTGRWRNLWFNHTFLELTVKDLSSQPEVLPWSQPILRWYAHWGWWRLPCEELNWLYFMPSVV